MRMSDVDAYGGASRRTWARPASRDEARFQELVRAYQGPLARYLASLGVRSAELDDAVQEVLIVASGKLDQVPPASEGSFLFGTALRVASNARRGGRRRERMSAGLSDVPLDASPSLEDLTDELFGRAVLDEAVEHMPPDLQPVFLMVEIDELSVSAVARRLGLPEGTVASRLRRARGCFAEWCALVRESLARTSADRGPPSLVVNPPSSGAEVLSWWVQRGETDALRALLRIYERSHPRHRSIASTALDGFSTAHAELSARMSNGRPPDTFQVNGGNALRSFVRRTPSGEQMDPIDFLFASERWDRVFPADLLDLVSHRGRLYAVPLDVHRTNSLFYNVQIFNECGLEPPSTLDEMAAVARVLRGRGVVPLALGYRSPWTLTLLAFEAVLVGEAGAEYYRDLFAGRRSPDDPEVKSALARVSRMLDDANDDAADLDWDGAVDRMRTGGAAMTIMGDWAKGYLLNEGCRPGVDFGQAPSPGCSRAFVFATDVFGLPKRAAHPADAIDLLKVFGSKEGQTAFNQLKGSIPARVDVDVTRYDASARATMRAFAEGSRVPSLTSIAPAAFCHALDAAMGVFARDRDPAVVIATIRAHDCLLRNGTRHGR
jgi:glucose/mannose transport system substrate-binding protein